MRSHALWLSTTKISWQHQQWCKAVLGVCWRAWRQFIKGKLIFRVGPLHVKHLRNLLLLFSTQHNSLFQIAICCLWRQLSRMYSILQPTQSITHCQVYRQSSKFIDCTYKSHDLEIAYMISWLRGAHILQSWKLNWSHSDVDVKFEVQVFCAI